MADLNPTPTTPLSEQDQKVLNYVVGWRNRLRQERFEKLQVWNECWALYRGQQDFSTREDWQTKIVLPKAWATVKQAVNVIKSLIGTAKTPWTVENTNNQDPVGQLRAEKMTELTKVFLEKAHFSEEFTTGLETGFIIGLGVWKVNWVMERRLHTRVQTSMVPAQQGPPPGPDTLPAPFSQQVPDFQGQESFGQSPLDLQHQQDAQYPTQLPRESLLAPGSLGGGFSTTFPVMVPQKQTIQEEILEGKLVISAVDPYNFYWLPDSKFNRWSGTIEEMEMPKWKLLQMAQDGAFPGKEALIKSLGPKHLDEVLRYSTLRFGERPKLASGPTPDTGMVSLTEFYGPLVIDGELIEPHAHVVIANDSALLLNGPNERWHRKPPYGAFSPLQLPFRTEGVGLIENVRSIDQALNQIVNLGVDTLIYRLMPLFEMTPDVYENPEDIRTGLTPGKILRRNTVSPGTEMGLRPVQFQDVSSGALQMAGVLDRGHQEGGLVSELQQSLPRWSGAQTATETQAIQQNQNSFFGSLAADIEQNAIAPLIELVVDTLTQYLDTSKDPRVAQILGIDQLVLAGMTQPELMELVAGDFEIQVKGLSGSLEKAEMLQSLIQFMNLIGQNPEAWLPYLNQDALLRRILEAFRPAIHDIEEIIADPQTAAANKALMEQAQQSQQLLGIIPQLTELAHNIQHQKDQQQLDQSRHEDQMAATAADQAIALQKQSPPSQGAPQ